MTLPGAPLLAGLALSIAVMAGTLTVAMHFPVDGFPSIVYACRVNGLSTDACQAMAREAGLFSLVAYVAVLAAMLWRGWAKLPPAAAARDTTATPSQWLFVAAALGLFGLHLGLIELGPIHVSRLNQTEYYSTLISLENLLLPALLQLYVATPTRSSLRMALLAALLMGMSLSPYRAMLMALFLFGLVLPFLISAWDEWRRVPGKRHWRPIARQAVVMLIIGATLTLAGLQDTKTRSPTLMGLSLGLTTLPAEHPLPAEADSLWRERSHAGLPAPYAQDDDTVPTQGAGEIHEPLMPPADLVSRLAQRIVFPLYQSAIAAHLAETDIELPTLLDQILRKLRLSNAPNLEEFLFRRIYGGRGHGETTSLTYGEASAYFPGPPILWVLVVPLLLILCWRLLTRRGLSCGTLFGFALWRTSFSGLFPILPSLVIQTVGLWVLHRIPLKPLSGFARLCLTIALTGALLLSGYALFAQASGQRDFLYAGFELESGCWLESPSWVPRVIATVGAEHDLPMKPVLAAHHRTALVLAIPYGEAAVPLLDGMRGAIASLSRCQAAPTTKADATSVRLLDHHVVQRASNVLMMIILATLAMALIGLWREHSGRTGDPR